MRILVVLLFIAGAIMLQIFLSKRERKWPGLVLPIIAFFWLFIGAVEVGNAVISSWKKRIFKIWIEHIAVT